MQQKKRGDSKHADHRKVNVSRDQFFQLISSRYNMTFKLTVQRSCLEIRIYVFVRRVVQRWNGLPQNVIDAPAVIAFKNYLDNFTDMGIEGNA